MATNNELILVPTGAAAGDMAYFDGTRWQRAPRRSVHVTKSATQLIADSTQTSISFDQETFDNGGFHDNATNNSRLTIPSGAGGRYVLFGQVTYANDATPSGTRYAIVRKNGTTDIFQQECYPHQAAGAWTSVQVAPMVVDLAAGDYLELQAYQSSGGDLNVENATNRTFFGLIPLVNA